MFQFGLFGAQIVGSQGHPRDPQEDQGLPDEHAELGHQVPHHAGHGGVDWREQNLRVVVRPEHQLTPHSTLVRVPQIHAG